MISENLFPKQEMITEMALGLSSPLVICKKYGYDTADFTTLINQEWFVRLLEAERTKLKGQGYTIESKADLYLHDMMQVIYESARMSDSLTAQIEAGEFFAQLAGRNQKKGTGGDASGPVFTLKIVGSGDEYKKPEARTIDVTPSHPETPVSEAEIVLSELPAPDNSQVFNPPGFDFSAVNADLRGNSGN